LLNRYDPFREMLSLRNAVDQLFEQSFVHPNSNWSAGTSTNLFAPMNVYETSQGYYMNILIPGVKPDGIELTVQQNTLTVKGQFQLATEEGKERNWLLHEIGSGSFERTVTFEKPVDADHIETSYEYGVLKIFVPVHEASRP